MRNRILCLLVTAGLSAGRLQAQDAGGEPARAEVLRQRIENRFAARVQEELGLSDGQLARLRVTSSTYGARRRVLEARERDLRSALAEQMRPGVAANQDSVSRLTDALVNLRSSYAQTAREENQELSTYLSPVQRSQLLAMRERFRRRIQEIQERQRARREFRDEIREGRQGTRRPAGP